MVMECLFCFLQVFNQAPFVADGKITGQVCSVDWFSLGRETLKLLGAVPVPYPAELERLPPAWSSCAKVRAPPAQQPRRVSGSGEKRKQQELSGTQGRGTGLVCMLVMQRS